MDLFAGGGAGVEAADYGAEATSLVVLGLGLVGRERCESGWDRRTVAIALRPATPAPITRTLHGGI